MNFYLNFIAKHEEKISVFEILLMVFIAVFLGVIFIFSLSLENKESSLALLVMLVLSLASVHCLFVVLTENKQFGKDIEEACAQAEKKWGEAKKKFEEEKNAEFSITFRKIMLNMIKFGLFFLPVGLLGYKVDWWPIFHNIAEWLHTLGAIFVGIFS